MIFRRFSASWLLTDSDLITLRCVDEDDPIWANFVENLII